MYHKNIDIASLVYYIYFSGGCMANVLNTDKRVIVIAALAEGSSIRSIERMTGIHRDTIMRLGVRVGQGCTALLDAKMRNLDCKRLDIDERFQGKVIWDGIVEVFELHGHPDATHAYAWAHPTDDPENRKRSVAVLNIPPATSPETAVRVAIMQELCDAETA